jgi:hypothetical protein
MDPLTLLLAGVILLGATLGLFVIAGFFPKTRSILVPLMFLLAGAGIACNTLSIALNLLKTI